MAAPARAPAIWMDDEQTREARGVEANKRESESRLKPEPKPCTLPSRCRALSLYPPDPPHGTSLHLSNRVRHDAED